MGGARARGPVDDTNVYFLDFYGSTLHRVAKTGGAPSLLATDMGNLGGFAIDATSVYLAAGSDVVRIDKASSASTVLATTGGPAVLAAYQRRVSAGGAPASLLDAHERVAHPRQDEVRRWA